MYVDGATLTEGDLFLNWPIRALRDRIKLPAKQPLPQQILSLFLECLITHTVNVDKGECEGFRNRLVHIQSLNAKAVRGEEFLVLTGRAIQAVSEYSQRAGGLMGQQSTMLRNVISMLTHTVNAAGPTEYSGELKAIEAQLVKCDRIEELAQLRSRLEGTLNEVRLQLNRQKEKERSLVSDLRQQLVTAHESQSRGRLDLVTGLPALSDGLAILEERCQSTDPPFLAVAAFSHLEAVNRCFGPEVGDGVLRGFSELVRLKLQSEDYLFRWRGPAVVAILKREVSIQKVRIEVHRICQEFAERLFDSNPQRVISASPSSLVLRLDSPFADVVKSVDAFMFNQLQQARERPAA